MKVMVLVMMRRHPFARGAVNIWMFSILLPTVGQYVHKRTGAVNISTQSNEPTDILQLTPWSSASIPNISFSIAMHWLAWAQWAHSPMLVQMLTGGFPAAPREDAYSSQFKKRSSTFWKNSSLLKKWGRGGSNPTVWHFSPARAAPPSRSTSGFAWKELFVRAPLTFNWGTNIVHVIMNKQDHQWWRYHRRLLVYQSPYF